MVTYVVTVREREGQHVAIELDNIEAPSMWHALQKASEMMKEWEIHETTSWPD